MRCVAVLLALAWLLAARGQSWQDVYDNVMNIADEADEAGELLEDSYELLEQLASHPLDLNHATREELEQLPFLSQQQVMDLQEYLFRYGPMRSLGELRMIRSLDHSQLALLPFFVYVGQASEPPPATPRLDSLLHRARHTLSATVRLPFYERAGDKNGYLGYPYRHTLRYELSSGQQLRLGFVAAQDAGEPFLASGNKWGYDSYSFYLQMKGLGRVDNAVVGRYKLAAGSGLVLGQSFQLGKLATLQSLGRTAATIRPHASRSEADYFQGAAATVSLWKPLKLSAFLSYRPMDATLADSSAARTLISSGYHRTPAEMAKKGNTHIAAAGMRMAYHRGALRLGATAVASALDRTLKPQRETLYRRHYANGKHFLNASLDYAYTHHHWALQGETAIDGHGALATINSVSLQPSARLGVVALQRFYSYRYTSLYGHSFGEGSLTQNESGIYVGATWNPLPHVRLQGYADYAYFPWARYLVSLSSHAWDFLAQATWQKGRWTLTARHRSHLRQRDNNDKTALVANNDHRERLSIAYEGPDWALKTQGDFCRVFFRQAEHGWMVSQHASWNARLKRVGEGSDAPSLLLVGMAALFHTDSYQSRIYVYERQLQHEFYFPTYYGYGLRLAAMARCDLGRHLRLALRFGYTNYFDRSTIGTALQTISHSHQSDLDVQLRWRF